MGGGLVSDPSLEKALIARLLYDPEQLPLVKLSHEDFSTPDWGNAFRAMLALSQGHRTIDIATLGAECPGVDFRQLLDEISPAHRASVEEYANQIRDLATRRRLVAALEGVIRRAADGDTQSLLSDLSQTASKALAGASDQKLVTSEQAVQSYLDRLVGGEQRGYPWAPDALNQWLRPAQGGQLILVAARPSIGKSVVGEMTADAWWQGTGRPVLFVSLEMTTNQLIARAVARAGLGRDDGDVEQINRTLTARSGVWYLASPRATTTDIRAATARVKLIAGDIGGLVIDYVGLIRDKGDNENVRIGRISNELKALALEYEIPVMALSQLNRNSVRREDSRPKLDDLRDSGSLEQDCDVCLALHGEIGETWRKIGILKNRDGAAGLWKQLTFDPERVLLT